jgi:hypothetical protein
MRLSGFTSAPPGPFGPKASFRAMTDSASVRFRFDDERRTPAPVQPSKSSDRLGVLLAVHSPHLGV